MGLEQFLSQRIDELIRDRAETIESLEVIRDKIKKADEKRSTQMDTEYYHKWSEILRGLESQLDKAKIHLTSVEAEIEEKKQKLDEVQSKLRLETAEKLKRLREIIAMPAEEFAGLSFEDMELLQEHELSLGGEGPSLLQRLEQELAGMVAPEPESNGIAVSPPSSRGLEEAEIRPSSEAVPPEKEPAVPAKKPETATAAHEPPLYVAALRKVSSNTTGTITLDELEALAEFHHALMMQAGSDPQLLRTRNAVVSSLKRLAEDCGRIIQHIDHTLGASTSSNGQS